MNAKTVGKLARRAADPAGPLPRRRRAAKRLAAAGSADALLALAAMTAGPEALAEIARRAFADCDDRPVIDRLCMYWCRSHDPLLGDLIRAGGWVALTPVWVRIRTAHHCGRPEALARDGADTVAALLDVADDEDGDPDQREYARRALASMQHPAARDAVCAAAIDAGSETALRAAVDGGYRPEEPARHALLLFLAGAFDHYEELDFDGALLRAARRTADSGLLSRLAAVARTHGRLDWVRTVADRRTEHLADEEWDTVGRILAAAGRWDELWDLAIEAAPIHAVALLRAGGRPPEPGSGHPLGRLVEECARYPVAKTLREAQPQADSGPFAVAADGRTIAFAGGNRIRAWRLPSGDPIGEVGMGYRSNTNFLAYPQGLALTPDGGLMIASGHDVDARCWRLPDLLPLAFPAPAVGRWAAVSPRGDRMVTSDAVNAELTLRRLPDRAPLRVLATDFRQTMAMSADGSRFAAVIGDHTHVWDLSTGQRVAAIPFYANDLALSSSGDHLVGRRSGEPYRLWRLPDGEFLGTLEQSETYGIVTTAFTPDGSLFAATAPDAAARIWRIPSRELVGAAAYADLPETTSDWERETKLLAVTHDGRLLVISDLTGYTRLRHLPSGEPAGTLQTGGLLDALVAHPDGFVAAARRDGSLQLWTPRLFAIAQRPLTDITPFEARALRELPDPGKAEQPWIELITHLVEHRHRYDIEIGGGPGATDIALDPEPEET